MPDIDPPRRPNGRPPAAVKPDKVMLRLDPEVRLALVRQAGAADLPLATYIAREVSKLARRR